MTADAYCFQKDFQAGGPIPLCHDRHYLLYAQSGVIRLQAADMRWSLPPARAALIAAGQPISVTILTPMRSASVLFTPLLMAPTQAISVFEVSPLARELIAECRHWGPGDEQPEYARSLFAALAAVTGRLAEHPSPFGLPVPRSAPLARALALTEAQAQDEPDFASIARATGQSERALARRFEQEMGMTWRQTLRRVRIMRAVEQLVEGNTPVTRIALSVGYQSVSAFNAAFREVLGMSPTAYRQSLAGSALSDR